MGVNVDNVGAVANTTNHNEWQTPLGFEVVGVSSKVMPRGFGARSRISQPFSGELGSSGHVAASLG